MSRTQQLKHLDRVLGPLACCLLRGRPAAVPPPAIPASPERLLFIRPGGIGDMLLLIPSLLAVRKQHPSVRLEMVCESRNATILDLIDLPVERICYDRAPLRTLQKLRSTAYDAVIDTEQFHNFSAVFAAIAQSGVRIGFNINPIRNALYTHLVNYDVAGHESAEFAKLTAPFCPTPPAPLPGILAASRSVISGNAPVEVSNYILLHMGGSTRDKHWPVEHYAALSRHLAKRGIVPILTGGQQDKDRAQALTSLLNGIQLINMTGCHALCETAALCAGAMAFIGPDSGLAHLSVALGVPTVALFGSSDPQKWGHPESGLYRAIREPLGCSPCAIFGYTKPCTHFSCVRNISPERVIRAVDALI